MGALQKFERGQLEHPAGERWVSMTNALARAGSNLTLAEKRIVGGCGQAGQPSLATARGMSLRTDRRQ